MIMLGLIALLAGIALLATHVYYQRKAKQALTWPATRGRILASELQRYRLQDTDKIRPLVVYEYSVANAPLQGHAISVGAPPWTGTPEQAVAKYPSGAEVDVFYDPGKPSSSILEKVVLRRNSVFYLGCMFVAIGVIVMLL